MPPLGPPLSHVFYPFPPAPVSSFRVAVVSHRRGSPADNGCPSVCFDSERGADPATTWKSVGTSACGEERRGVDGGVCVWCSSKRNFGNFTTNG